MKIMLTATSVAVFLAGSGFAVAYNGAGQPNENAAPIGVERATRNSAGGDREKGGFGPAQSDAVKDNQPYGQALQEGGWTGSNK
ncbi:hypothetical protein P1J78_04140 [Psychromarinibacter sp. C21-152]|uniref:Uncharacterized protein n=1 Tax=Psychromarinibacter sediminicola TaxID=3033385 RepID=A0AAE3T725_9RHOB|nr:hypothetical protein [Psychromarinibacter sediminicola]MDF0599915.1 hypothetical protein [Psychromarinibacter sediminicola]